MRRALPTLLALAGVLGGHLVRPVGADAKQGSEGPPASLDCAKLACEAVLPAAESFAEVEGSPWAVGKDAGGETVGWAILSTDVVDVPAYSGKPLVTLVGLDTEGVITGARVVHHSEPILLVGIPESDLHDFVDFYAGKSASDHIVVGRAPSEEAIAVDVISGATVTALAQNRTILDTARKLGAAVGVVDATKNTKGHFVEHDKPWSWDRMVDEGVFGRLTVTEQDMGFDDADGVFVDLWFTVADAPQVGRALMGDGEYEHLMGKLEEGEHLFVVLGDGSGSFKGSAFVRGGIFDRVRVQQELTEIVFRDTDYENLSDVAAADAPEFEEGAVFITRDGRLDPGRAYDLVFLGSRYDGKGGFSRDFREFPATHELPSSVYLTEGGTESEEIWVQAWRNREADVIALGLFLMLVMGLFAARKWLTSSTKLLNALHVGTMLVSLVMVGFYMSAQPSVTQILTAADTLVHGWRWDLFLSEPLIFMLWIFILVVSLIWGRGVFCGWVCPYGALSELSNRLAKKLHIPQLELPDKWHRPLRWLRYVLLAGLIPVFLWSSVLGEQLAEVEPFKSTFYVPAWTRHWGFFAWWAGLLLLSLVMYRPFCRYVCPLGAGLAVLNTFRFAGPKRRSFCSSCKICTRGCEPRAIRADGTIDSQDCLSCMECEANYRDEEVCPPLVGIRRLENKPAKTPREQEQLVRLRLHKEDM